MEEAYGDLSRVAVFLEQATSYEDLRHELHGSSLRSHMRNIESHVIDKLLCHLKSTVEILDGEISVEVSRDIIPERVSNLVEHWQMDFRDYMVLRDLEHLLKILRKEFVEMEHELLNTMTV